jgi:uncharacterized SAM-binding protein YcdF (DUF218 family)
LFLFLSKSLDFFLAPLSWVFLLGLLALVLARRRRLSITLGALALLVLVVFSSQPMANAMAARAEPFKGTFRPEATYDAVILLGGFLDPEATSRVGRPQYREGAEQVITTYELLRMGLARNAIISGGLIAPEPGVLPEAEVLKQQLVELGIPEGRIITEGKSRNTRENALLSKEIVAAHGWSRLVLVTSASHMKRAEGCFKAAGLEVDTYPDHYHLAATPSDLGGLFPRARNLTQTSDLIRELFGRLVYRVMRYSKQ